MKRTVKYVRSKTHGMKCKYNYSRWSTARRKAVYGWTEKSVRRQLVRIDFLGRSVYVHKKVAPRLIAAHKEVRRREKEFGWSKYVPKSVQCFNWRNARGSNTLSRHAHAIAIDIEPSTNPMYKQYNGRITMTIPVRVVRALKNQGFKPGLEWNAPCDTMHFEIH